MASLIPGEKSEPLACDLGPLTGLPTSPVSPSPHPSALTSLPFLPPSFALELPCLPWARPAPAHPAALSLGPSQPASVSSTHAPRARTTAVTIVLFSGVLGVCWNVPLSPLLSC